MKSEEKVHRKIVITTLLPSFFSGKLPLLLSAEKKIEKLKVCEQINGKKQMNLTYNSDSVGKIQRNDRYRR